MNYPDLGHLAAPGTRIALRVTPRASRARIVAEGDSLRKQTAEAMEALVVPLMAEVFEVTEIGVGINYGLDRLRFPAPVPVGSRVRVSGEVLAVTEVAGGYQISPRVTFEIDGGSKPACVADMVLRYYR